MLFLTVYSVHCTLYDEQINLHSADFSDGDLTVDILRKVAFILQIKGTVFHTKTTFFNLSHCPTNFVVVKL